MPEGFAVFAEVSAAALDPQTVERFVVAPDAGALVSFHGIVRDHDGGRTVQALEYQAHPDAEQFLHACCLAVAEKTGLRVAAAHRVGLLQIGDIALVAAVAAAHRAEAFAACADLVEQIKTSVPIWKRQQFVDGKTEWVSL